jgi:hypothetical protein
MSGKYIGLDEVKPGDVILFPPHKGDWIAWGIAYLTQSEVNHAAICYNDGGKKRILESVLNGLVLRDFDASISGEYPLRISRLKKGPDMAPLMAAAKKYLDNKDQYPFFDLAMLSFLLLYKRFSDHRQMLNEITYRFMWLTALLLMEAMQKVYRNKHPMTCSQFTAQCFTDAGPDFDFRFEKLYVNYDNTSASASISFLDFIINSFKSRNVRSLAGTGGTLDFSHAGELSADEADEIKRNGEMITEAFGKLLNDPGQIQSVRSLASPAVVPLDRIAGPLKKITLALYKLVSGNETAGVDVLAAAEYLNGVRKNCTSSTARNFFVAPEDIFSNCVNLQHIGLLKY